MHARKPRIDVPANLNELHLGLLGPELRQSVLQKFRYIFNSPRGRSADFQGPASIKLLHHMRTEQQMIRDWVDSQAEQQREIKKLLEVMVREKADR